MDSNRVLAQLPALIKAKRRETKESLRDIAQKSGISASTLSRLERGTMTSIPDTETLTKMATWLEVSLDFLLQENVDVERQSPQLSTPDLIEVHLRADKDLSPETAMALSETFRLLYNQFAKKS